MSSTVYLCHECGTRLATITSGGVMLWCARCCKRRRVPTDPRLVHPEGTTPSS